MNGFDVEAVLRMAAEQIDEMAMVRLGCGGRTRFSKMQPCASHVGQSQGMLTTAAEP